ncbi:MAG: phytoene desaturase family protein [Gammaproteobacteria bacterium]|nr:phytoene desaturase family protein [Gammaproteobacteria bacterium]
MVKKIVIMGGGLGGMASALRLRSKGYEVTLVERCHALGGRAQVYHHEGYQHDAGPTVITAPHLFESLWTLFDQQMSDDVTMHALSPWYQFVFQDGSRFDYGGQVDDTLAAIKAFNPDDVDGYLNLLKESKKLYDVGFTKLADQPFHQLKFLIKQVPSMLKLGCHRSVWQWVCQHLKDDRLRRAFSIQPLLVGGNPMNTTCIYGLIHFLERAHGIHFPKGGMGGLIKGLTNLMQRVGIEIITNATVTQLNIRNHHISSIVVNEHTNIQGDYFVSNLDPLHLYRSLIPKEHQNPAVRLKTKHAHISMGLFVIYFGTKIKYPNVKHHTILFGETYEQLLNDIFSKLKLNKDISIYLHRPTATDPSLAPHGHDGFYALVPVPNLLGNIDWSHTGEELKKHTLQILEQRLLPELSKNLTHCFYKTPHDFKDDYLSEYGAGFSIAPRFTQSAWFRFHNKAEGLNNLFLCGAGTHPGAGLPGVLSSAKIVSKLVEESELVDA